uniref:5-hydroxytryptamine receptor 3A n=1 Tax=Lates calcarifer TaxID=8187 RepID=A0A4W6DZR5_LATCA
MVMDIVGFYLPPDSGERVSFKITLLLGYSVFLIIVSDTLPATAIGTPLIGVYFVVCMALLVISLTETVLIVRLVHKQDLQPPVPHWVKYLVLERAPVLFCIHKKHRLCSRLSSQASDLEHYKDNNYGTGKAQVKACTVVLFILVPFRFLIKSKYQDILLLVVVLDGQTDQQNHF